MCHRVIISVMIFDLKILWKIVMDTLTPTAVYVTWNQKSLLSQSLREIKILRQPSKKLLFPEGKWQLLKSWGMDILRSRSTRKNKSWYYLSEKVKDGKMISFDKENAMSKLFLVTNVAWEESNCLDIIWSYQNICRIHWAFEMY